MKRHKQRPGRLNWSDELTKPRTEVPCACGCGQSLPATRTAHLRYIQGHSPYPNKKSKRTYQPPEPAPEAPKPPICAIDYEDVPL